MSTAIDQHREWLTLAFEGDPLPLGCVSRLTDEACAIMHAWWDWMAASLVYGPTSPTPQNKYWEWQRLVAVEPLPDDPAVRASRYAIEGKAIPRPSDRLSGTRQATYLLRDQLIGVENSTEQAGSTIPRD